MLSTLVCWCSYVAMDPVTGKKSDEAWVSVLVRSPEYWNNIKQNAAPRPVSATLVMDQATSLVDILNATDDYDTRTSSGLPSRPHQPMAPWSCQTGRSLNTPFPEFWGIDTLSSRCVATLAHPPSPHNC